MVDWDELVHAPLMAVFGEPTPVQYSIAGAPAIGVDGIFDEGARDLQIVTEPGVNEVVPILGVRLAQFPAGFNPRNAKGDAFLVRGVNYIVKNGKPDSHGWAFLEAARA